MIWKKIFFRLQLNLVIVFLTSEVVHCCDLIERCGAVEGGDLPKRFSYAPLPKNRSTTTVLLENKPASKKVLSSDSSPTLLLKKIENEDLQRLFEEAGEKKSKQVEIQRRMAELVIPQKNILEIKDFVAQHSQANMRGMLRGLSQGIGKTKIATTGAYLLYLNGTKVNNSEFQVKFSNLPSSSN